MKTRYIIVILCACFFSLILTSCNNSSNLPEITYDSPQSAKAMTLKGEKYFLIGGKPYNIKKNQRIAIVKAGKNLPNSYVYTIKGYDEEEFLIVEDRTIGTVLSIYAHNAIKNIPWELLVGNVMLDVNEHIKFNDKNYYYLSKTPSEFLVEKKLGQVKKNNKTISVHKIQGMPQSKWIAVKDISFCKEGYMLYYIKGSPVPKEYIEIWRKYGR